MVEKNYYQKLTDIYNRANDIYSGKESKDSIKDSSVVAYVDEITNNSEKVRGVLAVITTLMTYKALNPTQDIRYYQVKLENGFSARTIDTNYITPFLKEKSFPAPSTTGWLTRTLESSQPYTLDYKPAIKPESVKKAFLQIIDEVQNENVSAEEVLVRLFANLIERRESEQLVDLAKPHNLSIAAIVTLLRKHFTHKYIGGGSGASRLPVLALYSAYQCMMSQVKRYDGKKLSPLGSHTTADTRTGAIGDIEVLTAENEAFEGVEVKHEIVITTDIVKIAYEKFKSQQTKRYYILTTADMSTADWESINSEINKINSIHGCQVIVNGVYDSLKYYLRLLDDTSEFIEYYVENLKKDDSIKFQHRKSWNDIISGEIS